VATGQPARTAPPGSEVLTVIKATSGWAPLDLAEIWEHRGLAYFFTWRDIKVRYKQSVLGIGWAVIQPFVTMVVFTLFFGKLAKIRTGDIPYPIFSYSGLLAWTYFSNALNASGNSLVASGPTITKVYFPRILIPAAATLAYLLDFAIAAVILVGMIVGYYFMPNNFNMLPNAGLLMVFPLTALCFLLALGVGLWLSALNVQYRDVRQALGFIVRLWMFATPIVYPLSMIPKDKQWVMALNPMTGVVEGYRAAFLGQAMPWALIAESLAIALVVFITGAYYFKRMERSFADVV